MATSAEQLALIGRHIDRLTTVEARISPTSRNVMLGCIVRNGLVEGFKRAF